MAENTVHKQWASRPDDERFLSLQELYAAVDSRAESCDTKVIQNTALKAYGYAESPESDEALVLMTPLGPKFLTHWSFGQISQIAGAPAGYLRKLPTELVALNLNHGIEVARDESMIMALGDDLRCATSPTYGRIFDRQVVKAIQNATEGGSWKVPGASYASTNPKRATTLYASDRDCFIFLVDEDHPIEFNGESLFRGFYVWNSEVGAQTFGLACFLYRYVCDNRLIWGMQNKQEIRIRHTSGAPERFAIEGRKALIEYSNQSTAPIVEQIQRAQSIKVGKDEDEVKDFLRKRGVSVENAKRTIEAAKIEEGSFNTPWSLAQGMTAAARSITHTDTRVEMERQAGKILDYTLK